MRDETRATEGTRVRLKTLRCRRTGRMLTVEDHVECPYCYGAEESVRTAGRYEAFCGYRPGKDPLNFGFPPESTRTLHG